MNKTPIEYADYSWNPITGCLGPEGSGKLCPYCYAARLARGRLRHLYLANKTVLAGNSSDPFAPRFWCNRLDEPYYIKRPCRIFVGDMADMFGPWVPLKTQALIFETVRDCKWHIFLFLTKWPQCLPEFNPWPDNAWVGATATGSPKVRHAIDHLHYVQARVKYVSIEPLLAHVEGPLLKGLNWLIIGAQTGPGAVTPKPEWVVELRLYAQHFHIPIFLKDNLHWPILRREYPMLKPEEQMEEAKEILKRKGGSDA